MSNFLFKFKKTDQAGFTLLEMAMVMAIIGLVVGSMLGSLGSKLEDGKFKTTQAQLDTIEQALLGYAAIHGHMPCPTLPNLQGQALAEVGNRSCDNSGNSVAHGFIPANTLGISGPINEEGLLLDAWNQPIRYSVAQSNNDTSGNGLWDIVTQNDISDAVNNGTFLDSNAIVVCRTPSGQPDQCSTAANTVVEKVPAVVYSTGAFYRRPSSGDENENIDGPLYSGFQVGNDNVFVNKEYSKLAGSEFDDLMVWISPNTLYLKMLEAGRL